MKKDLEEENKIEDLPEEIIMMKDLKEERRTEDPQENRNNIERKDNNNLKKKIEKKIIPVRIIKVL